MAGLGSLFAALRPGVPELTADAYPAAPLGPPLELSSPFVPRPSHLASVVYADVFGLDPDALPMDRGAAMRVPAAARLRHIVCGTAAEVPLRAYSRAEVRAAEAAGRDPEPLDAQPAWIDSTASALPPFHRMLWTADDLLWHGWSCWSRVNGADGFPVRMDRIAMGRWSLDDAGRVKVDRGDGVHALVDQRSVCLIPGPHEGLLVFAQEALRHARDLQAATVQAARNPAAHLVLTQTEGTPLADPEIDALLDRWAAARRGKHGGVGFLSRGLKAEELGSFASHLLESGRNAAAVDIARAGSLPADLLDAAGESSLTYANARDNDVRAVQWGIGMYLAAISAALSQDGITPRGQVVRFAVESWLADPTPPAVPSRPGQTPQEGE